ncbi:MAG: hypothetical protein EHM28_05570 [Spirochaetaceae bacterium]|nr:MAG: hypothetical protein EHM28_05570 [Spirochaetaceae bacterium]
MFLLDKFVPEVFQSDANPRIKKQEGGVDIVLSDDAPVFGGNSVEEIYRADEDSGSEEYSTEEVQPLAEFSSERIPNAVKGKVPENIKEGLDVEGDLSTDNATDIDEPNESFYSDEPVGKDAEKRKGNNIRSGDSMNDLRESEKDDDAYDQKKNSYGLDGNESEKIKADEDVDVLPDMSAFESSFSVPDTGDNESGYAFDQFSPGKLGDTGIDKDPEILTKAVRTIIKRDEKGS